MKIVYFNYLYDLYEGSIGSTIKAIELMDALARQGHTVNQYWLNENKDVSGYNQTAQSRLRSKLKKKLDKYLHEPNQILKNLSYVRRESRIIRREKPDLVISRLDVYLFSTWLVTRIFRLPWLVEADSPEVYEYRKFYVHYKKLPGVDRFLERFVVRAANRVFVVSNLIKQYFVKQGSQPGKIVVIPNGADFSKYKSVAKNKDIMQQFHIGEQIVVGFVGSFHYWHGVENLIKIMDAILEREQNVVFFLVGSGGVKESEIRSFVEEKDLINQVLFAGNVPHENIAQYISVMDIVLAPYPQLEFFYYSPMKMYEYMAAGKAVVASKLGQIAEVVKNEITGLLFNPDNVQGMIKSIEKLIHDQAYRLQIGMNARKDIELKHNWDLRGKVLSGICEEVLANHKQ